MALLERLEIVIEADARTAEREFDRIGRQAEESLGAIETAAAKVGDNASAELAGASSKFADAGRELSAAAGRELDLSAAAREAAADLPRALESQRADVEQAGRRLGDAAADGFTGELEGAVGGGSSNPLAEALDGLSGDAADAGQSAGADMGSGIVAGLAEAGVEVGARIAGLSDEVAAGATSGGQGIGENISGGIVSGLAETASSRLAAAQAAGAQMAANVGQGLSDASVAIPAALDDAIAGLPPGLVGPASAAAAVVGAAFVNGFADAIQSENLGDVIAARVGEGAAESERFARVSADVYRDAWGESTAEVSDAIDAVYSTLADSRKSEGALRDLTTRAQAFADVFNQDVGMAVSNAGVLIETGLARNAVEAFDLMTAAAQRVPAAMRDELSEATQEYSTFFAALGFDGRESFAILTDAAQEGRYELDKTGDAMKELTIRATDLSDVGASTALRDLGIDARDAANALLEGGDAARSATQQIFDALSSVEDPAEQARIAIALMGAPLEDLNKAEIPEFIDRLADASDGMRDAAGASDELTNSLKNTETAVTTVKRELLGAFEDYANDVLQPLADYLNSEDPDLKDAANSAGEFLGRAIVDAMYLTVGGPLSLFFDLPGKEEIKDALGLGDDEPIEVGVEVGFKGGDPGLQLDPATGQLIPDSETKVDVQVGFKGGDPGLQLDPETGQLVPDQEVDISLNGGDQARLSLQEINREIELSADLYDLSAQRAESYLSRIANSSDLDDAISAQLDLRDAARELADGLGALQGVDIDAFASGTVQVSDEAAEALGDISGAAAAAQQQIANALEWEGEAGAIETAGKLRDQFVGLFNAAGLSDQQILELLASMGLLPEQVTTAIELSGADEALAKLDLLQGRFTGENGDKAIPDVVQTQVDIAIAEGRFVDAANLLSIWVKDQEDGSISDPLLIAMGLGDTAPASGEVESWKSGEEAKPPVQVPVGADTGPARGSIGALMRDIGMLQPVIKVGTQVELGAGRLAMEAVINAEKKTGQDINGNGVVGRAVGGPVMGDTPYMVNERGSEIFVPSTPGFVMDHSESTALIEGVRALVSGGGSGVNVTQNIRSTDPIVSAREAARKMRDAVYLEAS